LTQRKATVNISNLTCSLLLQKKDEFMQLLADTPSITSYSHYPDVREDISHDPRFQNVDSEEQRQAYFDEHINNMVHITYN